MKSPRSSTGAGSGGNFSLSASQAKQENRIHQQTRVGLTHPVLMLATCRSIRDKPRARKGTQTNSGLNAGALVKTPSQPNPAVQVGSCEQRTV